VKLDLVYSPEAINDLEEIFWFIAGDNPGRARTYIAEIQQACRELCEMPLIGVARPDLYPNLRILSLWRVLSSPTLSCLPRSTCCACFQGVETTSQSCEVIGSMTVDWTTPLLGGTIV
jgi:plasmid stabilization system protein ParE